MNGAANTTALPWSTSMTAMMAAIDKARDRLGPPLPKSGPGPDLKMSRDVHEALRSKCEASFPNSHNGIPWTFYGLGVEVCDLMPDGLIIGLTEAGKQCVREARSSIGEALP